ncbi:MAG: Fic family protein [Aestuariivirga sp.]
MDLQAFKKPSGEIVTTIEGYQAFVPSPLPPKLDLVRLTAPLVRTMQKVAELKGASRRLPNPHILIPPLQRREALTSSAMEGTYTTVDELVLEEAGLATGHGDDRREVFNYIVALQTSLERMKQIPISHRLIKEAHAKLLRGLSDQRGANKRPGEYKQVQNMIGGKTPQLARFVPPPPAQAQSAMDSLEVYINRPNPEPSSQLIDLAIVHYQFETIHPFSDGNGRIGRMLTTLMAVQSGLLDLPVLYVSNALEGKKDEYIDLLFAVSAKSEWENWIIFFLDIIAESCSETIATIDRLIALHAGYRKQAPKIGRSANLLEIIDQLFNTPILTIPNVQKQLNVSHRAALLMVEKLVSAGVLREIPRRHPRLFTAPEIIAVSNRK